MELKSTAYEVAEGIATLWLNRPHRGNGWTGRMHAEYRYLLDRADKDPAIGVILVSGKGNRFCVGADAKALEGHVAKGGYDAGTPEKIVTPGAKEFAPFREDFAYHFALSKPVIAVVNGAAAGVGLVLACYADIRFAVPDAKLTTAHGSLNLPAEYGLSWLLPRLIGGAKAAELLLSSRIFMTEEAHAIGLVQALYKPEVIMAKARAYALELLRRNAPESLKQTKRQIYLDYHRDIGTSVREAGDLLNSMMRQPDYAEAVRAFLEKRPPRWGKKT